jgi:2-methylisocitrate lyase-like PEP mutase family enzyme
MARRTGWAWRGRIEEYTAKLTEHRRCVWSCRACADGLFIEAPVNVDELERIGRVFDVPQLANMLEGGRTPLSNAGRA